MEDLKKKNSVESSGDKEILYSKAIKAGKRIYYLDVKKSQRGDLFLAITESKKVQEKGSLSAVFEKHKIFLYQEDFGKFMNGLKDVIHYVNVRKGETPRTEKPSETILPEEDSNEIKLDINFDSSTI